MSAWNTRQFLADTHQELRAVQIKTWLFGGWAEELWGLRPPGPHRDVDLLYRAADFTGLDNFLWARADLEEVKGKPFAHKRAFERRGVLVEVFLMRPSPVGGVTNFFGFHRFQWPEDALSQTVSLLGVVTPTASPTALCLFRERHKGIEQAYRQHLAYAGLIKPV